MDFSQQIKTSIFSYWRAFRFIDEHNLWHLLIFPAIINIILSVVFIVLAIHTSKNIVLVIMDNFHFPEQEIDAPRLVYGFLLVTVRAGVLFIFIKLYRYSVLVLQAPVFAFISEKVQTIITGKARKANPSRYLIDSFRGISLALRNFVVEILLSTLILAIALLAGWIAPVAPLAILALESYFMGYSFSDYRNEHFNMSPQQSRKYINAHPGLVIGNGLCFNMLLLVPILGTLAAPVFALIAAGLSIDLMEKRKSILCNSDQ